MKVFISYSYSDVMLAKRLANYLEEIGIDVWYADANVFPGENWAEKVSKALEESEAMIVLLTSDALNSRNVLNEISLALGDQSYTKRLIPIFVGNPDNLPQDKIPWILKRLAFINLSTMDKLEEISYRISNTLQEHE